MKDNNIQIQYAPIHVLIPAEYNPRKASEKEWNDVKASIEEFGIVDPIIANSADNRKNIIIGGHLRWKVADSLGYKNVPVVYLNIPNEDQEHELNLRLNKNLGGWDFDMLANFNDDLLKKVGFDAQELGKIFDLRTDEDDFDAEEEYDKIEEPKTKKGDIYKLGRHRLMCGDSTSEQDVSILMKSNLADIIFTDPPYNVNYDYTVTFVEGRRRKRPFHAFSDEKKPEEFMIFIRKAFENAFTFLKDDGTFYCWHVTKTDPLFRQGIEAAGGHISLTIFWLKNNCSFTRGLDYLWSIEPCFYGWKKGNKHFVNKVIDVDMKNIENLQNTEFQDIVQMWYEKRDKITEYGHPTQKPVRLAERAIRKSCRIDGIVLDLFGGSGSTLLASEQMGRSCYMMELDPKYCDVIVQRWEKYTGQKAELVF